ncbi:hypothetical protein [Microbulbifer agarilyticus]|uniref:hypothetical protein n=1 Tax=Microbulbifer agarilyticus TaxID=260552 RepID=UPI001CD5A50C|nr:hypothetical protein [Microbulbifer agarilyticus]MCA0902221.1 hypothetical protein [Microbulbifer agarilyticus]
MRINYIFHVMLIFPLSCIGSDEISHLQALDTKASEYRKMSIECITDAKLSKKPFAEIDTCKLLYKFTTDEFPGLKDSIVQAEESAKLEGEAKGLGSPDLREKLVLIMSAKSHMSIAGSILNKAR